MMKGLGSKLKIMILVAAALTLLFGCGTSNSEHDPSGLPSGTPADERIDPRAVFNTNDTTIVDLNLKASAEYDVDTGNVRIFVIVEDQDGNLIPNFNKYNFSVSFGGLIEDIEAATLTTENSADNVVALILDSSGSMTAEGSVAGISRMEEAKNAAKLFVDTMIDSDKTGVIDFDSSAIIAQPLTENKDLLKEAIDRLEAEGGTNLGSGIFQAVDAIGARPGKRVGILMTDGENTVGEFDSAVLHAAQSGIKIFTIGFGTDIAQVGGQDSEAVTDLKNIANNTGGQFFDATSTSLIDVFAFDIPQALSLLPAQSSQVITLPTVFNADPVDVIIKGTRVSVRYENAYGIISDTVSANFVLSN